MTCQTAYQTHFIFLKFNNGSKSFSIYVYLTQFIIHLFFIVNIHYFNFNYQTLRKDKKNTNNLLYMIARLYCVSQISIIHQNIINIPDENSGLKNLKQSSIYYQFFYLPSNKRKQIIKGNYFKVFHAPSVIKKIIVDF